MTRAFLLSLVPGLITGLAIAGAVLLGMGLFRSDDTISLEEGSYGDGGDTRAALTMQGKRIAWWGMLCSAAAIILPVVTPTSAASAPPLKRTLVVAVITALTFSTFGWLHGWIFWHWQRPPEVEVAEQVIAKNKGVRRAYMRERAKKGRG